MRWGGKLSAAVQWNPERRRWSRLPLAIPAFIRGVNGQGREFLEFGTLLNESAGGVLLAIRKPLRRWSRVTLEIPSAPLIKNLKLPRTMHVAGARDSNCLCRRLEPLWAQICPPTRLITQNGYHWFTVYFHASLSDAIRERTYTSTCKPAGIAPADLVDLAAFRRLGARSMIAVPLLNRMKMADGAFDWDGYALVGIAA